MRVIFLFVGLLFLLGCLLFVLSGELLVVFYYIVLSMSSELIWLVDRVYKISRNVDDLVCVRMVLIKVN